MILRTAHPGQLPAAVLLAALTLSACSGSSGSAPSSPGAGSTATVGATGAPPPPGSPSGSAGTASSMDSPDESTAATGGGSGSHQPEYPDHPVPSTPASVVTVQGQHATYTVKIWAVAHDRDCAAQAFGPKAVAFLNRHPCTSMVRRLATTTVNGRAVGLSQATLRFPGPRHRAYNVASRFERIVHNSAGSAGIDDLFGDGYGLPSGPQRVPSPNASDDLVGIGVVNFGEAWYLDGTTPDHDPALISMTEDLFQQL